MTPQMQSRFQIEFGFAPRPVMRLRDMQELIRKYQLITPVPSRPTLVAMIEDGTLEGKLSERFGCYMVYQDSFLKWLESFAGQPIAA